MKFIKFLAVGCGALVLLVIIAIVALVVYANFFSPASRKSGFINEQLSFSNQLYIPPLLAPRLENGEQVFDLNIQEGETEFFPGKKTRTLGFNGNYLGLTIRAREGDRVRINVTNTLSETTTTHWHGMDLPAAMDGNSHQVIQSGTTWRPHWTINNEAATLWYHPHKMGKTGEHVYRGLAGMFIIDDENSDSLNLPKEYGVDDIPLVVQDREFDENGQLVYEHEREDFLGHTGMLGDTILVNGTYAPYIEVPAKLIRLRVLNGSNARRYNFGFANNQTFYQIATDGGLLESPVERTRMILGPGERAEIVVDLTNETKPLTLISDTIIDANPIFRVVKNIAGINRDERQMFKILEIRPQATTTSASASLPQTLNSIERLDEKDAVRTRQFRVGGDSINGKRMDPLRIDEIVRSGDIEIWEISQVDATYHPFHIHGVQFLILDRNGNPPSDYERGWKDTVVVNNGETVRVLVQFPEYSDPNLPYMFHCHILEHEDMGMMGQFVVVNEDVKEEDIFVQTNLSSNESPTHSH